ncbi:uncharacterized protein EI97DRAFT_453956 [Westerdykella ornata]|uniref:Uncharacterized protein n=1 Tax=Westerdykella ornata TaxID=318751 RepID=A0A6A6JWX7_WESOR|nr:uncharacterized protein EI97DRAFT_453956 [Westerdykella ornata]KAF2280704.1 hypothetical protein EI97DRAFT_453956 [Westerdykella ornata]
MDVWNPSSERFAFSRHVTRTWRQLYHVHHLQWYRWVLRGAAGLHLTPNFGKLYWHYSTHHSPSVFPDFLAFSLSVAARVVWHFLFRDPGGFLGFKRPGRGYRWVVAGILGLTTLPNGVVHVWALKMALRKDMVLLSGVVTAVLAIVFFVPLAGLAWWMAWKYLLAADESNEEFEPVVKWSVIVSAGGQVQDWEPPAVEPYRDEPADGTEVNGYLAEAYGKQTLAAEELLLDVDSAGVAGPVEVQSLGLDAVHDEEAEDQGRELDDAPNATSATDATLPSRCPTLARFEYMPQRYSGPHSWFSYPIIPVVLSTYGTILLIVLPIFIHEDRAYDLRAPSPTLKRSLDMPLGLYLLSFYAAKHCIRASLFERFSIAPPEPWKQMISILPSWFGTGGTFKNQDTGEITVYDPRRRAFPWQAYRNPALIRTRAYIKKYNDCADAACTSYWGHSGRPTKSDFRFRPTIYRVGFLLLAGYFALKGFWNTVFYDVPNEFEERLRHWKSITPADIARIRRILALWQGLVYTGLYFTVMALSYAAASTGSMVTLFFMAVWKHVPEEAKEETYRAAREAQEREIERRSRQE